MASRRASSHTGFACFSSDCTSCWVYALIYSHHIISLTSVCLPGAPSLSLEQYRLLNLKQIQTDTLSHFVLSRVSTFSLSSLGDLTYSNECMEASQIYLGNSQDVCFSIYILLGIADPNTDGRIYCARVRGRKVFPGKSQRCTVSSYKLTSILGPRICSVGGST